VWLSEYEGHAEFINIILSPERIVAYRRNNRVPRGRKEMRERCNEDGCTNGYERNGRLVSKSMIRGHGKADNKQRACGHDEHQPDEVKSGFELSKCMAFRRVELQCEEQEHESNCACWEVDVCPLVAGCVVSAGSQKHHRLLISHKNHNFTNHVALSVNSPPSKGPSTDAIPQVAPRAPL
jgi:hypothetical protein